MLDPYATHPQERQPQFENTETEPNVFDDNVFADIMGFPAQPEPEPTFQREDTRPPNEEVRYQYWQSQADKLRNELEEVKKQVSEKLAPTPPKEEEQRFPDAPAPPRKPAGFTYEEAMGDPRSQSAQYLAEKEEYDRNIHDYNTLRVEYELAQLRRAKEDLSAQQRQAQESVEMEKQRDLQMRQAAQMAMQRYGADPATAIRFVQEMSSPESMNMDNLWALFTMRSNGKQPSQQFRQTQRAQQTTPPMGVMPGGGQQPFGKKVEDLIMDDFIRTENMSNPW